MRVPMAVIVLIIALATGLLGAGIGAYAGWVHGYNSGTSDTLRDDTTPLVVN